jgi:hypothetical protein
VRSQKTVACVYLSLVALAAVISVAAGGQGVRDERARESDAFAARSRLRREFLRSSAQSGLLQLLEGIDSNYRPIPDAAKDALKDPMAVLLFKRGTFPSTLAETLKALEIGNNDATSGVPGQRSFLIGEGGEVPFSPATNDLDRTLRYVVARFRGNDANVLLSTSAPAPDAGFLQVIAWDAENGVFNYYERLTPTAWAWRGNSRHSLASPTRGRGCFDCHVNGSLVMKELEIPWQNWHSMVASIDDAVSSSSPLRTDPLFLNRSGGEDLEKLVIRPGISRWNAARTASMIDSAGQVRELPSLLRHLFETTTVNLGTSRTESSANLDKNLRLEFFLNKTALFDVIGLDPPDNFQTPVIGRTLYQNALATFGFTLASGSFRQPGDTHFASLAPEAADEDLDVLARLLDANVMTPRFAACVLMIDFQNPVFSPIRQRLSAYVPPTATIQGGVSDLPTQFAAAVTAVAPGLPADSPERQFLDNWNLPEGQWQTEFDARIKRYLDSITPRLMAQAGVNAYFELAESRRREFARRPLHEPFDLMLPVTNIPANAPTLQMNVDGTVGPKPVASSSQAHQ